MASLNQHFQSIGAGFPSPAQRSAFFVVLGLVAFLFPFGIVFVSGGLMPERFLWTGSIVIALNGVVVLLSEFRVIPTRIAIWQFLLVVAILFVVEFIGSRTGLIFGRYAYAGVLIPTIMGVPLVIAIAWYGTVVASGRIVQGFGGLRSAWQIGPLAGLLTVALDVVLEPVASGPQQYWLWEAGEIPIRNYVAWFAITVLAAPLLTRAVPARPEVRFGLFISAGIVFSFQWLLFVLSNLKNGQTNPVVVSVLLISLAGLISRLMGMRHGKGHSQ